MTDRHEQFSYNTPGHPAPLFPAELPPVVGEIRGLVGLGTRLVRESLGEERYAEIALEAASDPQGRAFGALGCRLVTADGSEIVAQTNQAYGGLMIRFFPDGMGGRRLDEIADAANRALGFSPSLAAAVEDAVEAFSDLRQRSTYPDGRRRWSTNPEFANFSLWVVVAEDRRRDPSELEPIPTFSLGWSGSVRDMQTKSYATGSEGSPVTLRGGEPLTLENMQELTNLLVGSRPAQPADPAAHVNA